MPNVVHLVPRAVPGRIRETYCGKRGGATIGDDERKSRGLVLVTSNPRHANCAICLAWRRIVEKV